MASSAALMPAVMTSELEIPWPGTGGSRITAILSGDPVSVAELAFDPAEEPHPAASTAPETAKAIVAIPSLDFSTVRSPSLVSSSEPNGYFGQLPTTVVDCQDSIEPALLVKALAAIAGATSCSGPQK